MKKAEELKLYTPEPERPELDAGLCMSVAEGQGAGRYIKGKTLTVAVWNRAKAPLVVWRFCGDYWTGELRDKKNPTRGELDPRRIDIGSGRVLSWRIDLAATSKESELLRTYFEASWNRNLIEIVEDALSAHNRKKREQRNARQAEETKEALKSLPEPPKDFEKQILAECDDAVFLWVTDTKKLVVRPGGEKEWVKLQNCRCDSCGGEHTVEGRILKHKTWIPCPCCGKQMMIYNTRYPAKSVWANRTVLWSKPQGDGVWVRRYLVCFGFENHRAELGIYARDILWTDGKQVKKWKCAYSVSEQPEYIMCQKATVSSMLLAPTGPYQPYELATISEQVKADLRKVLKTEWMYQYDDRLNFLWEVRQWDAIRRYPMAESLIKTGWSDALATQVYDRDRYYISPNINLRSKTYYGVFGLNRQELALVSGSKRTFRNVDEAVEWKKAGLAITGKNMAMTANIRSLSGLSKTLQEAGMTGGLKYLRQQTRRITGAYNGQITPQVASDWMDYVDMARKAGMNLKLEKVLFPLDLKRRHDELVTERKKLARIEALRHAETEIKNDAEQLENQFHIGNIYKKIRKIYEYDGAEYIIRVPEGAEDILRESQFLDHCIRRGTRYFERIATRESYIFFMRKKADPNTPWYTLEVEPGGTVRQKRSYSNDQYPDLEAAKPFIAEWQQVVQQRMNASEVDFAKRSQEIRNREFEELKANGNIIRTGSHAGRLLVDELMHDLMEVEKRVG